MSGALFRRLLGARWPQLSPSVRAMHAGSRLVRARGIANVDGASTALLRFVRALTGLPQPKAQAGLILDIEPTSHGERWTRCFAGSRRAMVSFLHASPRRSDAFEERIGPACFVFALAFDEGGLRWETHEVRAFGLRLPLRWFRGLIARCHERDGRYAFDVRVELPVIGLLVAYSGWLEIIADE